MLTDRVDVPAMDVWLTRLNDVPRHTDEVRQAVARLRTIKVKQNLVDINNRATNIS
jgi:hypothetical protein